MWLFTNSKYETNGLAEKKGYNDGVIEEMNAH